MIADLLLFIASITVLLVAAKIFTKAAESIGAFFRLPSFVIGVFIVGIGTSLPELISGILSVKQNVSEILAGNIIGSNISNLLLITGLAVVINRKSITLDSGYIYVDLHFLLGGFMYMCIIAYDGRIYFAESFIGLIIFLIYSFYLIKSGAAEKNQDDSSSSSFPIKSSILLIAACAGIYFGAEYTITSLQSIAISAGIPNAVIALTLLSLGTTLPELAVNVSAIRQGKPEMAVGNILGSCIFNTLVIPSIASTIAPINVPANLIGFALPLMVGGGLLFYLLTQDKKISIWEGLLFVCLYMLFIIKTAAV